jgi:hypothetical protein
MLLSRTLWHSQAILLVLGEAEPVSTDIDCRLGVSRRYIHRHPYSTTAKMNFTQNCDSRVQAS